ncbi:MAG: hypothetical protein ABSD56_06965 [Bryobacteraceae bacterium]
MVSRMARVWALVILVVFPALGRAQTYDLLLKGGHVIDPANQVNAVRDVAVAGDKIARVAENIPASESKRVVDVSGYYVTPGLVDIHAHLYVEDPGGWGIYPDLSAFPSGVTTAVDAGSAGWKNFEEFKARIIDKAKVRVLAFLNIVAVGMDTVGEQSLNEMDARPTAEMIKKHPQILIGVKAAHYEGPEWEAIDRAVEAGRLANVPVMVDFRPQPTRTYADLMHFLNLLDGSPRLLIIESLGAAPDQAGLTLSVTMKLNAFVRESAAAPAAGGEGAAQ